MDDSRVVVIQLVARRYRQLQGFRTVMDGVFLLALPLVFRWDGRGALMPGPIVGGTILFVAVASLVQHFVGKRYDRRFGRVDERATGDRHIPVSFAFFVAYAVGVIAFLLCDAPWPRALMVVAALGAGPAWVTWRDWPYRAHWLLPCLVAVAGGLMFTGVHTSQDIAAWSAFVWRAGGLAAIAAGLLDHALLVRVMTRTADQTPERVQS